MSNPFLWKDLPESFLSKPFVFLVGLKTLLQCTENQTVLGASDAPAQLLCRMYGTPKQELPKDRCSLWCWTEEVRSPGNRFGLDWEMQCLEEIICNPR